jgi:ACS family hexuronate transporter-like MFS transporter
MSSDSLDPVETVEAAAIPPARETAAAGFGLRWVICGLLFFATTINYVDRVTMSVLEPDLRTKIGWSADQWGDINAAFMLAYAIGSLLAGWMMDKLGTRLGFCISLVVWSLVTAGHALAQNVSQFMFARFALGIGESGNFPGAVKTTAEWFPKGERALATGIFNSGSNFGPIIAALVVPALAISFGWQSAFISTGIVGLVWVFFWWPIYRRPQEHPWVTPTELAYIESDPPDRLEKVSWAMLLPFRQTWAFAAGKFMTDSIWWFYVFWFPKFMNEQFGLSMSKIGLPMVTVYALATVGSVFGGGQSSMLLSRGWTVNAARKTAMLTCAVFVVPVIAAPLVKDAWIAVILVGLATAAHQGFSCNLFTLTSDMFPRRAVGSVVGIGTFAGAMGGFLLQISVGRLKESTGDYVAIFAVAGSAYLAALLVIHLLVPRVEPVEL